MDDGVGRSFYSFEGFLDNMFAGLGKHLDRNIIRDHVLLDQGAKELILRLGCSREADLDHFKSYIYEQLEKFQFLIQAHGFDQRLVAVTEVHAAPDRRFIDRIFLHPVVARLRRHKIAFFILFPVVHFCTSPYISSI